MRINWNIAMMFSEQKQTDFGQPSSNSNLSKPDDTSVVWTPKVKIFESSSMDCSWDNPRSKLSHKYFNELIPFFCQD